MTPLDELIAYWTLQKMLAEKPLISDSTPPATWAEFAVPRTLDHAVDPMSMRGLIHGMPSGSEARMPQPDALEWLWGRKARRGMLRGM